LLRLWQRGLHLVTGIRRKSKGAAIGELLQVLSGKTRPQIQRMLNQLQASGRIHMKGKARGARWHLVKRQR
ncbi:MAG: hypothetical protein OXI08_10510, partial [Cyanobacteria bacterium MAG IRC4_bin_6]|nr:hypothetical protein [Cyanobacteria bacterium MAG IRC3_bin_20]MDE0648441.1 hypothetical protein [Cyanobacteria bacterium MAG IRC4_bin_6]